MNRRKSKHKEKLNIAMFGQKRIPSREGGVEIVVEELCTRMVALGHNVTCYNRGGHHVSGSEYDSKRLKEYKGIKLKTVPTIEKKGLAAVSSSFFAALCCAFGKYDVVHIHAEGPAFFAWLPKMFGKSDVIIDLVSCRGFDPKMKSNVDEANFHNIYRLEYRDTNQIKYFLDLYKIMKKEKYDVIHVNGQSATMSVEMLAAKLAGCKLRVAHSHNSRCLHKKAHNMLKPLFNATYNDAIACSKEAGDWLFGDKPYWILNNGIDIDKYKFSTTTRTEFRKKLKLSDKDIAVCHVGAFEPWKY